MEFIKAKSLPGKVKLFDNGKAVIVNVTLEKGKTIPPHKAIKNVFTVVLKGKVLIGDGESKQKELSLGEAVYMDAGDNHTITAIEDSEVFVLHF